MFKKTATTLKVILTSRDTLDVDNQGATKDNKDNGLWQQTHSGLGHYVIAADQFVLGRWY